MDPVKTRKILKSSTDISKENVACDFRVENKPSKKRLLWEPLILHSVPLWQGISNGAPQEVARCAANIMKVQDVPFKSRRNQFV
jgi:hypothetical protein